MYNWTDGELVTAEKLNNYSEGMEEIREAAETAQSKAETAQGAAETAQSKAETAAKTAEETVTSKAPLDSPAFTGTPTAPTPDEGDDSTRIATTAFVEDVKSAALGGVKFSITDNGLLHVEQEV